MLNTVWRFALLCLTVEFTAYDSPDYVLIVCFGRYILVDTESWSVEYSTILCRKFVEAFLGMRDTGAFFLNKARNISLKNTCKKIPMLPSSALCASRGSQHDSKYLEFSWPFRLETHCDTRVDNSSGIHSCGTQFGELVLKSPCMTSQSMGFDFCCT